MSDQRLASRKILAGALQDELLGPCGGPTEKIAQSPSSRYLLGRLVPRGVQVAQDEDEGLGGIGGEAGDDNDAGVGSPVTGAMNPSSIGLSFVVDSGVAEIRVVCTWGEYLRVGDMNAHTDTDVQAALDSVDEVDVSDENAPDQGQVPLGKPAGEKFLYGRRPQQAELTLPVSEGPISRKRLMNSSGVETQAELWVVARQLESGKTAMSIFLVNGNAAPSGDGRIADELCLFQPKIEVSGINGSAVFVARGIETESSPLDSELSSLELLYWNRPEFAEGHGCAADWNQHNSKRRSDLVKTDLLPQWELPRVDPLSDLPVELRMDELGGKGKDGVPSETLRSMLLPLADSYEAWIENTLVPQSLSKDIPEPLRQTAKDHVDRCKNSLARLREGIETVTSSSPENRLAFCFANRAMALQRRRWEISLARRRNQPEPVIDPPKWRPFQLAFVLVTISSLVDRTHRDREAVDLLWFPTGGGKTEAYLGLTAFSLAHRRLREPLAGYRNDAGVTVLMRYTLRLLTIQQFQRATTLICACEQLRVSEKSWGEERFSIGLWVGKGATPNRYSEEFGNSLGAKEVLAELAKREPGQIVLPGVGTPLQLLSCPWCGSNITVDKNQSNFLGDDERQVVDVFCSDQNCKFSPSSGLGIPAHVVDQQLYRHVPSLVIATVDKFAQMPFNGRIQALFGKVSQYCSRHGFLSSGEGSEHSSKSHKATAMHPAATVKETNFLEPPDLIIQDELHLISGPLGTLVGAYETAINFLSSVLINGKWIGPKVIASTATVRRADKQVGALFDKRLAIFPALGIDSSDSWFGKEIPTDKAPGRLYVGVYAPGKSVKTALVRVYATLLSKAQALLLENAKAADPYMTLVGYYNSLRELGGAIRLLEDDVPARMGVLTRRSSTEWPRRYIDNRYQLTSNLKSEEVPDVLRKLEIEFTGAKTEAGKRPVDVLLASNMISVGVDIDRLGLMVVTGQPKTTAEYIQATSRVGRQAPGLVICVYNWSRSRDTSHYQQFRSYHSSLYRFVEATSVTPFSSRARDKALQALLCSMIRLGDKKMTPESGAKGLDRIGSQVKDVLAEIEDRAGRVAQTGGHNKHLVSSSTSGELKSDLDDWQATMQHGESLSWTKSGLGPMRAGAPRDPNKRYLIDRQEDSENRDPNTPFVAPGSLREVESEVHVFLIGHTSV